METIVPEPSEENPDQDEIHILEWQFRMRDSFLKNVVCREAICGFALPAKKEVNYSLEMLIYSKSFFYLWCTLYGPCSLSLKSGLCFQA